jgi:hypothetical protein
VFEIGLRVVSDLSGTERSIVTEKRIEHPGDANGQPHMQFGWGSAEPDEVVEAARTWKLGHASLPYFPELDCDAYPRPARTIPADRFRIFVADEVYEAFRETGHEEVAERLATTVNALNDLDEYRPSDAYIDTMQEAQSVAAEAGAGSHTGSLRRRKRQIENTIRAKLDFSKRYGGDTPDPHPEFADNDLNTLQQLLEDTEAERTQAEARLENLKDQLATAREEWLEQTRATLPAPHHEHLSRA